MGTSVEQVAVDPFTAVVSEHWSSLVRLAALLMRDAAHAEDVVQDALVACLRRKVELRNPEAALAYLRRAVVNGARSRLRRRLVARRHEPAPEPDAPGADEAALAGVERDAVITALRALPRRQREALGSAPYPPDFGQLQLVTSAAGRPRYVFVVGGTSSVGRLDLTTGVVTRVVVDRAAAPDGAGLGVGAEGVVDGRVLYVTGHGYAEGTASSDRPVVVAGSIREVSKVGVFDGRPYVIQVGTATQTAQAVDPRTLLPYGPVATSSPDLIVGGDGGESGAVVVHRPQSEATGVGGILTAYSPI